MKKDMQGIQKRVLLRGNIENSARVVKLYEDQLKEDAVALQNYSGGPLQVALNGVDE